MDNSQPLSQLLKDANGNLVRAGDPSAGGKGQLQQQSAAGGTPATPLSAALSGANPNAAQMAGTPNQVSAAPVLPSGSQPAAPQMGPSGAPPKSETLKQADTASALQASQKPKEDPAAQKEAAESQRMEQEFGDMGSKVQNLIHTAGFLQSGAGAPAAGGVLNAAGLGLTADQQASLNQAATSGSQADLISAANKLGWDSTKGPVDQFLNQYMTTDIGTLIKQETDKSLQTQLTPDMLSKLGYSDPSQLAKELGIPASQLSGMSLGDLQAKAQERLASEFNNTTALQSRATDPSLGLNERQAAQEQLRAAGVSGIYATEAQMGQLSQAVQSADKVQFNGQPTTVADLLSDQGVSAQIQAYVESDPGSDARKTLAKNEPQLAAWIDQHEPALREASSRLGTSETNLATNQAANSKIETSLSNTLGPDVATKLLSQLDPNYKPGQLNTDSLKIPAGSAIDLLMNHPEKLTQAGIIPENLTANIQSLQSISPEAAAHLSQLTPDQLTKLGAGNPASPQWQSYTDYVTQWSNLEKIDPSDKEGMAKFLGSDSFAGLQSKWDAAEAFEKMGGDSPWLDSVKKTLDPDGSGKLDPSKMKSAAETALGGDAVSDPSKFDPSATKFNPAGRATASGANSVMAQLAGSAVDGVISKSAVDEWMNNLQTADLSSLLKIDNSGLLAPDAKQSLDQLVKQKQQGVDAVKQTEVVLQKFGLQGSDVADIRNGSFTGTPQEKQKLLTNLSNAYSYYASLIPSMGDSTKGAWQEQLKVMEDAFDKLNKE